MRVVVLGAGIAGLSAAWALSEAGHAVTVIDRAGAAAGASAANGGQLSYSYVQPLADPSLWLQLPALLLRGDSPLRLRPRLDPPQWRWALAFLRACNATRSVATTRELLALAARSRAAFDRVRLAEGIGCDFSASGKLVLYRSVDSFAAARRQLDLQRALGGSEQHALAPHEVRAIEPALAHAGGAIAGAIYTPSECAADCARFCEELAARLQARGVHFVLGRAVERLMLSQDRVTAARLQGGEAIEGDAFVVALGCESSRLVAGLGARLPLYPLKGYSITLDVTDTTAAPRASITDAARKIVVARLGERLRVAGMAELVGHDASIPPGRIRQLQEGLHQLFPGACATQPARPWAGLRPATPTGVPLVGRHPRAPRNLLLHTGHGALGFTLAFGTAELLAAQLAG
jgi:D-amino-acid dehydrogenase